MTVILIIFIVGLVIVFWKQLNWIKIFGPVKFSFLDDRIVLKNSYYYKVSRINEIGIIDVRDIVMVDYKGLLPYLVTLNDEMILFTPSDSESLKKFALNNRLKLKSSHTAYNWIYFHNLVDSDSNFSIKKRSYNILKDRGFSKKEIKEIISKYYCVLSLNSEQDDFTIKTILDYTFFLTIKKYDAIMKIGLRNIQ